MRSRKVLACVIIGIALVCVVAVLVYVEAGTVDQSPLTHPHLSSVNEHIMLELNSDWDTSDSTGIVKDTLDPQFFFSCFFSDFFVASYSSNIMKRFSFQSLVGQSPLTHPHLSSVNEHIMLELNSDWDTSDSTGIVKDTLDPQFFFSCFFSNKGSFTFGSREYIGLPGMKYDPNVGIFGMDVTAMLERAGHEAKIIYGEVKSNKRIGDDGDPDDDNDGISDEEDNCPFENLGGSDANLDGCRWRLTS